MRWFLTGLIATVLALVVSGAAQACGCCGCCQGGGSGNCPQPAAGGSCPNCPQHAASYGTYRYWSSVYGCYLYYDTATRLSYYWSEPRRSYYPVQDNPSDMQLPPRVGATSRSSTSSAYSTQYFDPGLAAGIGTTR